MSYELQQQGPYTLFHTPDGQRILTLDGSHYALTGGYFTIAEGPQGELRALDDGDFEKEDILRQGMFKLVIFRNDPQFQNIPYLFLQKNHHYEEIFLPDGLPNTNDAPGRFIYTDHTIATSELEAYLQTGTDRLERTGDQNEPPFEDYFDLTAGDLAERIREMQPAELRRLEEFEEEHKNRSTILNTIEKVRRDH